MLPSTFISLSAEEKAFVIAAIDLKVETEKKQMDEAKRKKH